MDLGAQSMANALAVTGITAARDSGRFGALDGRGVRTVVIDTGIDLDHAFFGVDANHDGRADRIVYSYDFANGAPAVGAALDLVQARELLRAAYAHKRPLRNLYRYFIETRLDNIRLPVRRFFTTNDPVLTPAMMDHFFNRRTRVFESLSDRQRLLLRSIYDRPEYRAVLPAPSEGAQELLTLRQHQRFSIRCPARLAVRSYGAVLLYPLQVIELSLQGFQAECTLPLPEGTCGWVEIDLGHNEQARARATAVRRHEVAGQVFYGFSVPLPDAAWQHCVVALQTGSTHSDLGRVQRPAPPPMALVPPAPRPEPSEEGPAGRPAALEAAAGD